MVQYPRCTRMCKNNRICLLLIQSREVGKATDHFFVEDSLKRRLFALLPIGKQGFLVHIKE